jgi:hypothetical protein
MTVNSTTFTAFSVIVFLILICSIIAFIVLFILFSINKAKNDNNADDYNNDYYDDFSYIAHISPLAFIGIVCAFILMFYNSKPGILFRLKYMDKTSKEYRDLFAKLSENTQKKIINEERNEIENSYASRVESEVSRARIGISRQEFAHMNYDEKQKAIGESYIINHNREKVNYSN